MAKYNTFVVIDTKRRKTILVTSSARKANSLLATGIRIEVWNDNNKLESIYERDKRREANPLGPYIEQEREYIRARQEASTMRNTQRRGRHEYTARQTA